MGNRKNRIIAGAVGGMAGGIVMALAFAVIRRSPLLRRINRELEDIPVVGGAEIDEPSDAEIAPSVVSSALLGGIYGGLRSAFRLPGLLFGPVLGLASFGLSQVGLGSTMEETPGPWSGQSTSLVQRLVTHTVYGTVTDLISERVEALLAE